MPILLEAPRYRPGGPDGKEWNRLSLNAHMGTPAHQCAVQPRTGGALREVKERGSLHAQWGNHGRCTADGNCTACPMLARKPLTMRAFGDRVLVRFLERIDYHTGRLLSTELWAMNRVEDGFASFGCRWTWEDLVRLASWRVGPRHSDEHSDGFWLLKEGPSTTDGRPSPCPHEFLNPDHCCTCRIN